MLEIERLRVIGDTQEQLEKKQARLVKVDDDIAKAVFELQEMENDAHTAKRAITTKKGAITRLKNEVRGHYCRSVACIYIDHCGPAEEGSTRPNSYL